MQDLTNIGIDGTKLRKARDRSGMTQSEVAEAVGVQKAAISKIEVGRASPSSDLLARLCKLYGIDIASITGRVAA